MTRTEFWAMSPREVWWLIEAKMPPKMIGSLTEAETSEIYDRTYGKAETVIAERSA